jgi:hypothetical protein
VLPIPQAPWSRLNSTNREVDRELLLTKNDLPVQMVKFNFCIFSFFGLCSGNLEKTLWFSFLSPGQFGKSCLAIRSSSAHDYLDRLCLIFLCKTVQTWQQLLVGNLRRIISFSFLNPG